MVSFLGRCLLVITVNVGKKESIQITLPVELVSNVSFSPDDKTIIFTGFGSNEPSNIWVYSFTTKQFKKLTDSPHPGVNLKMFATPELVTFKSFDGLELSGWLYKP